jgi:hypothetical protein
MSKTVWLDSQVVMIVVVKVSRRVAERTGIMLGSFRRFVFAMVASRYETVMDNTASPSSKRCARSMPPPTGHCYPADYRRGDCTPTPIVYHIATVYLDNNEARKDVVDTRTHDQCVPDYDLNRILHRRHPVFPPGIYGFVKFEGAPRPFIIDEGVEYVLQCQHGAKAGHEEQEDGRGDNGELDLVAGFEVELLSCRE